MPKSKKIGFVILLFGLLIVVRAIAPKLFYDPLMQHFENDYLHKDLPEFNTSKLFFSYFFRYILNAIISLIVIYIVFPVKAVLKFSIWFYLIMFFVLICAFFIAVNYRVEKGYLLIFYIRRFIIHPLFVLLLVPAIYYGRMSASKN